jgi:hypothetical protein
VEVSNIQHITWDRDHSIWRRLLLPHGDLKLSVLTRLTLSQDRKVRVGGQWGCTVKPEP